MLVPQAILDRHYRLHERSLPDTGQAVASSVRQTPSSTFRCSLREDGNQQGGRFDRESGVAHAYRLRVGQTAPTLVNGDKVTVAHVARGVTTTVTVQVTEAQPATTHQNAPSYRVKLL